VTRWLALLLVVAAFVTAAVARAQGAVSLDTQVSDRRLAIGQSFQLQLTALVEAGQEMPQSPRLKLPAGFVAHGPSVSTQQQVTIVNGRMQQRLGLTATWVVTAQRVGNIDIGPASVLVGAQRVEGQRVRVEVVAAGQAPAAPRGGGRFPFDPFDPFSGRGLFPSLPGFDEPSGDAADAAENLPPFPEELRVERAPDPVAFLRVVVSPERAVVGEQVTLRVYAYGKRGPFREVNSTEPSRGDFLAYPIVENSYGETRYRVPIGGDVWYAVKLRELALFPIRAGKLSIGSMRMGFDGRGYPAAGMGLGLVRDSQPITLAVSEPPLAGRPPGYRIGDVGRYKLTAEVRPRQLHAGESLAVEVRIEGTGNVPFQISPPQQRGVEWLEPNVYDKVEPQGSVVGGFRKLSYVVRVDRAGHVDLGEVSLPHWDPALSAYAVARATLGAIDVAPGNKNAAASNERAASDRLAGIAAPRMRLGAPAARELHLADRMIFWWLLALGPVGVVIAGAGVRAGRAFRVHLAARRQSAENQVGLALDDARRSMESAPAEDATQSAARAAGAAERAIVLCIEAAVGLKARAFVREQLGRELTSKGVEASLAADIVALLNELDTLRFTGDGAGTAAQQGLVERTSEIVRRLNRMKPRRSAEARP
jgi:hypothetical protein